MSQERISANSSSTDLTDQYPPVRGADTWNTAELTAAEALVLLRSEAAARTQELLIQQALGKEDAPSEALVYLEKALKMDSSCSRAWLYSAKCYEELGDFTQALKCYGHIAEPYCLGRRITTERQGAEKFLKKHNDLLQQCEAHIQKREFKQAKKALRDILETNSLHPGALRRLEEVKEMHRKAVETIQGFFRSDYMQRLKSTAPAETGAKKRNRDSEITRGNKFRQLPDRACKNRK